MTMRTTQANEAAWRARLSTHWTMRTGTVLAKPMTTRVAPVSELSLIHI